MVQEDNSQFEEKLEEKFEEKFEEDLVVEEIPKSRAKTSWVTPLMIGAGLGLILAFGGMQLVSRNSGDRTNETAQAANNTSKDTSENIASSMSVTVVPVETTRIVRNLPAKGAIAARNLTPVLPQTNGLLIKQVLVKEGDFVRKGQVMAVLDDSLIQDQIRQAKADVESRRADIAARKADLSSQEAALQSSKAGVLSSQATVAQRRADLAQAQARLQEAQRNHNRNKELAASGAISTQQLDTSATTLATSREAVRVEAANISGAKANVISSQASISSAKAAIQSAQARVKSAEANLRSGLASIEQLRTQLGQTVVRAPVSGLVAQRLARVGDVTGVPPQTQVTTIVGGTQKLFSIIENGDLELQAKVPETQISQVKIGAPVQVKSVANDNVQINGKVVQIEPVVNDTREAIVKIALPVAKQLKPGMFAQASINTTTINGLGIPQKALIPKSVDSATVFVVSENNIVSAREVTTGEIINGGKVEIKSGLQTGDKVVLKGAGYIKDGDKVRVVNEGEG
ncbi:MAG: efflux RND transporter periplasmic adaptor subunit [Cyanobacteria bacterium P01_A01_bin.45]